MNPRTTGIVFLIAAALAAFVYFYEIRGGEARKQAEDAEKRLFAGLEQEAIESISLITTDGRSARIERRAEGWEITEPIEFPADEFALDGVALALVELASEAVYEDPQPPEVYGLDADEREVRFTAGGEEHSLRLGGDTPMGSNSYVSVGGSDRVYTVPTHRIRTLRKSLDDLRDKRILRFDTAAIDRIAASWPGGRVVVAREQGGWRVVEPIEGPADRTTVDSLLSDLSFLRADGFLDEPPADAEVGLDEPAFSVELTGKPEGEEPVRLGLAIGGELDGKSRLVRAGRPILYRIPADRLDDFPRDLVEYRFKQLAEFTSTDARRLELGFHTEGEGSVAITATRGEKGWTSSPERIEGWKISQLVSELSRLRAEGILAEGVGPDELRELELSPPNAILAVYGGEDDAGDDEPGGGRKLAEVHLGILKGDEWIAARRPDGDIVFKLGYALAERIPVSLEALRNRFVVEEEDATPLQDDALSPGEDSVLSPAEESP